MEPGPLEIMPGIGNWPWAKPIGQRHGGLVVTMPVSGRGGLGLSPTQGRFSFGHQVMYTNNKNMEPGPLE